MSQALEDEQAAVGGLPPAAGECSVCASQASSEQPTLDCFILGAEADFADERAMQCRRGEMRGGSCGVLQELCRLSPRCSALWNATD